MPEQGNELSLSKGTAAGTSLVVQWLRLCASTARGASSIPGWGTKIPHAAQPKKKKKRDRSNCSVLCVCVCVCVCVCFMNKS